MSSLLPPGDSLQFSSFRALLEDSSDDLGPLHSTALDVAFTSRVVVNQLRLRLLPTHQFRLRLLRLLPTHHVPDHQKLLYVVTMRCTPILVSNSNSVCPVVIWKQ